MNWIGSHQRIVQIKGFRCHEIDKFVSKLGISIPKNKYTVDASKKMFMVGSKRIKPSTSLLSIPKTR